MKEINLVKGGAAWIVPQSLHGISIASNESMSGARHFFAFSLGIAGRVTATKLHAALDFLSNR